MQFVSFRYHLSPNVQNPWCGLNLSLCLRELEMRIDTQKQTLTARDESIKKLLEMLQNKGEGE